MNVSSLGFRTDLALLTASGSVVEDRGTHLVVRSPDNPSYFWGNFLLLSEPPVLGGEKEVVGAFHTEFPLAEHVSIGVDGCPMGSSIEAGRAQRFEIYVHGVRVPANVVSGRAGRYAAGIPRDARATFTTAARARSHTCWRSVLPAARMSPTSGNEMPPSGRTAPVHAMPWLPQSSSALITPDSRARR